MDTRREPATCWLGILCLAALAWSFSFGLGAPLASRWLEDAGSSDGLIGLNSGVYYLGIAVTSGLVPWMMLRWGRGCLVVGMIGSAVSTALFPWGGNHFAWLLLRWCNGVAGAMSLIPLETLVNRRSASEQRARNFGFYAFSVALGWALGNFVGMQMYPVVPRLAFAVGGLAALAGAVLSCSRLLVQQGEPERRKERLSIDWLRNLFPLGCAWSQGFLEGGMVAFLPLYLLAAGFSNDTVSALMSGLMIGVLLFQVPVAWLADRRGRAVVLFGCNLVALAGMICLPFCTGLVPLALTLFLVGACSGAFYPLGLALLGERTPPAALARASARFLGINCVGSCMGPVIVGLVMDSFGKRAMFGSGIAAVATVLVACAALRWGRGLRAGVPSESAETSAEVAERQAA
jgi:MFS family permease